MGVIEDPLNCLYWLVAAIIVVATKILPTYFRARGGLCPGARAQSPGAPPGSSRTCEGGGAKRYLFWLFPLKQKAGTNVAENLLDFEKLRQARRVAFVLDFTSGFSCRVTRVSPRVVERVPQSLYPGPANPVVLRAQ